jgi:hypothetical protein
MRGIPGRIGQSLGPCILLGVVSALSIGLNTDLSAQPRFDGAGYSVLGEALATGHGYREIDLPGAPRHAHYPPGYPAALAILWRIWGRSVAAAHVFSAACMVAAVLLAWYWLRTIYRFRTALLLGLALALNWTWGRVGGAIQSEPVYIAWEMLAVLAAIRAGRRGGIRDGMVLGIALAGCILTRHVGVCLVVATAIDLGLRKRWRALGPAGVTVTALVLPWVGWLAMVRRNTQVGLLVYEGPIARVAAQALFYLQRIPDQITGPFVEVGTVFQDVPIIAVAVNLWAALATSLLIWGWMRTLRTPRRRLAGFIGFTTLALLLVWPFTEAGRFLIPLLPFSLVGATDGLAALLSRITPRRTRPREWAAGLILLVSIPYAAHAVINGRARAQERTHADFDAACRWIARHATHPGLILARHPGEVFWQTGRQSIAPVRPDPETIGRLIVHHNVAYLLIDDARYANAAPNPMSRYVERSPDRVALVWERHRGGSSIRIFEVIN